MRGELMWIGWQGQLSLNASMPNCRDQATIVLRFYFQMCMIVESVSMLRKHLGSVSHESPPESGLRIRSALLIPAQISGGNWQKERMKKNTGPGESAKEQYLNWCKEHLTTYPPCAHVKCKV
eukprot:1142813-Pelagomonas_calceolata.AAC.1